jgi:hypothetical protein
VSEDIERPHFPFWISLLVVVLLVIGAITVVGWVLSAVWGLIKLAIIVAIVAAAWMAVRSMSRR